MVTFYYQRLLPITGSLDRLRQPIFKTIYNTYVQFIKIIWDLGRQDSAKTFQDRHQTTHPMSSKRPQPAKT